MSAFRPSTSAAGSAADCRWASLSTWAKAAWPRGIIKDLPLSLLCLSFGPVVYAAFLGTVPAMLVLTIIALVVSRHESAPITVKSIRVFAVAAPMLAWMVASSAWSLDPATTLVVALRVTGLLFAGTLLVASFAYLPLERVRQPLMASALGFSVAGAVVAADLASGGHLVPLLHGPQWDRIDPALAYGRAATLHAILLVPILVAVLQLGAPRLAAGYGLFAAAAILETSSLSAKTALAVSLLSLAGVWLLPRLRWVGLAFLGSAVVALPLIFPVPLSVEANCWFADHKPSALHRLEIWNFVAAHIRERPIAGWGLDAARWLPGGTEHLTINHCNAAEQPDGIALSSQVLPLHPHNAILEVWLELGGIGAALGFGPLIFLLWRAFRNPAWRTPPLQAMIAGTAAAAVEVGFVSFRIWQEWFFSGLFIAAAFVVLAARLSAAAGCEPISPKAGVGQA